MTTPLLGLRDEGRDALMRAALVPGEHAVDAWRRWMTSGADPRTDPVAIRWLPLVGHNLRDARLDGESTRALRESQRATWTSTASLWNAATPALDALAAAGIRTMVLKGAPLAFSMYPSPALRPMADIDVLVEPHRAADANVVLAGRGWIPSRAIEPEVLASLHGVEWRNELGVLDLHWYLLHECCWPGADAAVWRRARPIVMAGYTTLAPSPADHLLHVCVHGLRWSAGHSAQWVADAIHIIRSAGADLDWDTLVEEAVERGLACQVHNTLTLLRDGWGAAVPQTTLQRLRVSPSSVWDRLECRVKGRPRSSLGGLFVICRNWQRLERSQARVPLLRYIATTVGVGSVGQLIGFCARHLAVRVLAPWRRPRGTSSREKLRRIE